MTPLEYFVAYTLLVLSGRMAIHIPFISVPITLQTLAVHANIGLFGPIPSLVAVCIYVGFIFMGFPFGASLRSASDSDAKNTSDTEGYLLGFVISTYLENFWIYHLHETVTFWSLLTGFLLGDAIILALGAMYYGKRHPDVPMWEACVIPFIPGDVVKCVAAAMLSVIFQ